MTLTIYTYYPVQKLRCRPSPVQMAVQQNVLYKVGPFIKWILFRITSLGGQK